MCGVSVERFWRLTPAEIQLEIEANAKREERRDYRAGLICAVVANLLRDPKAAPEPFEPKDFMPRYATKEPAEEKPPAKQRPRQTWEDMIAAIRMSAGDSLVRKEV